MKVLLVTYHFPPDGEIGAIRPARLAQHLPEFGVEPWVLTVRPEFAEAPEPSDLRRDDGPEQRIVRTEVRRTHADFIIEHWQRRRGRPSAATTETTNPRAERPPSAKGRWVPAREWLLSWLAFPDWRIGWYRPAVRAGERLMRDVRFDAVVSTSPPRVAHLVAARLSRVHAVPWVMDFRDPWYADGFLRERSQLIRTLQAWLLAWTARRAAAIVANTLPLLKHLQGQRLARISSAVCIPNGFPAVVSTGAPVREDPTQLEIGYFGQMMGRRSARAFLEGLRLWLDRRAQATPVRVRFVGSGFSAEERAVQHLGLGAVVSFEARLPRAEVAELMARQWALLLLANEQPLQVPGKTYEYLATGRRILALTEREGATADLLRGVEGCSVVERPEEVAEALEAFARDHQQRAPGRFDRGALLTEGSYERRAEEFARLLREIVESRAASR